MANLAINSRSEIDRTRHLAINKTDPALMGIDHDQEPIINSGLLTSRLTCLFSVLSAADSLLQITVKLIFFLKNHKKQLKQKS